MRLKIWTISIVALVMVMALPAISVANAEEKFKPKIKWWGYAQMTGRQEDTDTGDRPIFGTSDHRCARLMLYYMVAGGDKTNYGEQRQALKMMQCCFRRKSPFKEVEV